MLTFRDLRNAILFAALVVLLAILASHLVSVILTLSIAALLIVSLSPIVTWLANRGIPRWAGTMALMLGILGLVGLLLYYIVPVAAAQLGELAGQVPDVVSSLQRYASRFPAAERELANLNLSSLDSFLRPFVGGLAQVTTSTISFLAAAVLILVITIYVLVDPRPIVDGFLDSLNGDYRQRIASAGQRLAIQIWAWARGTAFAMLVIFVLTYVALTLLRFEQALLFAVIAGVLELVPVVGPILSAVPPAVVALAMDPALTLWVIGVYVVIQQVEGHVIIPLVMARQIRVHPATVVFWVLVMGTLFGVVGIFIATPTAVAAGVLYDELYLCEYRKRCEESNEDKQEQKKQIQEAKQAGVEEGRKREETLREQIED